MSNLTQEILRHNKYAILCTFRLQSVIFDSFYFTGGLLPGSGGNL